MATASRSTEQGAREAALVDLRRTLDWLSDEVHAIEAPVDPILEMAAISKAFDNSKALVANNVTNYANSRLISNLWATKERCARLFGVEEFKDIKFKILESLHNPIAPREVEREAAPCQEVVLERDEIGRIEDILPLGMHTEDDGGRFFGNGVHFFGPPGCRAAARSSRSTGCRFATASPMPRSTWFRAARATASAGAGRARRSR